MPKFEVTKDNAVFVCDCGRKHTITEEGDTFKIVTEEPESPPEEETIWDRATKKRKA